MRVPVGRQPMASMSASQPILVWGPWRPMPPKTVLNEQDRECAGAEDDETGAEDFFGVWLHGHRLKKRTSGAKAPLAE